MSELEQETLEDREKRAEELLTAYKSRFVDCSENYRAKRGFIEGANYQAERMYRDLEILKNDLYTKLPTGNVDTFELLKIIKNHLQKLDDLCGNK